MIEIKRIRSNQDEIAKLLLKRGINNAKDLLDQVIKLDQSWRQNKTKLEEVNAEMNKISKSIGTLFQQGEREKAEEAKQQTKELKEKDKKLKTEVDQLEIDLKAALCEIPNVPQDHVPSGDSEEDNQVLSEHGEACELNKNALTHWELAEKYDLIDFSAGSKIAGAGFPVYKRQVAKLQRALINFFLDRAEEKGYQEMLPPHVVNSESGFGTGQLPDKEGQMYHITEDDLFLIPTSEVPLTNIYRDVMLEEKDLPIGLTSYTPCFRREAGSYGKHVRGLNRLHQFDKVELVRIEHPERSEEALNEMKKHISELLDDLGLQYRVLLLCGGDLGFTAAVTYDFEVYSAVQKRWLEVSSASNFETYQSNRLQLRFKDQDNKKQLAHTLNGSALALPRILAALLENYQEDDAIRIPEILHSYTGFKQISLKNN